ncbi:MAG: DNA polymerase domain-containing protein [Candidatus Nanohaloarchaea archaeon]
MFKVDFQGEKAVEWSRNGELKRREKVYRPKLYIKAGKELLRRIRAETASKTWASSFEEWRTSPGKRPEKVLRLDLKRQEDFNSFRDFLLRKYPRPEIRFFHAGLSPQFKYCIEQDRSPGIEAGLDSLRLELSRPRIAQASLKGLKINGGKHRSEPQALKALEEEFSGEGPDVLRINRSQVLSLIDEKTFFSLGRDSGMKKLAGENTVTSYGRKMHSPSRYSVSGRAVIDESSSFMLSEAGMEGLYDLVERTWKPLQEVAWASIGNILTAIEIRRAYDNNVLTPWKNWTPEEPKKASTMRKADRGGFIFSPMPGVYEDVHELDFASLFPNIMVRKNISPETVNCSCCNNSRVPELDYSICEKQIGFIPHVLGPIIRDRSRYKQKDTDYSGKASSALKWILVSCFGYMGHAHASYGAIECHQAIQAFDRKIMVETKDMLEDEGLEIKHGIIDSIWASGSNVEKACEKVSEEIGIELEHEHSFDWIAFVPRKNSNISTLNRYFGKTVEGETVTAGIEMRQSSTPDIVKNCQSEMIEKIHEDREEALKILEKYISRVRNGEVDFENLVIEKKISQNPEAYKSVNKSAEAAKRMKRKGIDVKAGQKLRYVVRDSASRPRVLLDFEEIDRYDKDFYVERLENAAKSVLKPFGSAHRFEAAEPSISEWLSE